MAYTSELLTHEIQEDDEEDLIIISWAFTRIISEDGFIFTDVMTGSSRVPIDDFHPDLLPDLMPETWEEAELDYSEIVSMRFNPVQANALSKTFQAAAMIAEQEISIQMEQAVQERMDGMLEDVMRHQAMAEGKNTTKQ